MNLRLCLVAIKRFPENTFKKISGKYFLVFGKEEGKHKSDNTKPKPRKKRR